MTQAPWTGQRFRFLFADEKSLYAVLPGGELVWFPQWATPEFAPRATDGRRIGTGWTDIRHIFAGGNGVIYLIDKVGDLRWYRDTLRDGSNAPNGATGWAANSGKAIGAGWLGFTHVLSGGEGLIYATTADGQHLRWYRDVLRDGSNAANGSTGWAPNSGAVIGQGWSGFRFVVSGGCGVIYMVTNHGDLRWYLDDRRDGSNAPDGSTGWAAGSGMTIGEGWQYATHVFAGGPGQIFACENTGCWGGYLRQYIDTRRDGVASWKVIADPGTQVGDKNKTIYSCGWQISSVEGYAWPVSVAPGETISFHVSSSRDDFCFADVVRLTGYGPKLGSSVPNTPVATFSTSFQQDNGCHADCEWPASFSFSAPSGMGALRPGFYAARVTSGTGYHYDIPFVIKRGELPGRIALIVNTNTWHAYNPWGGDNNYTATGAPINLTYKRPDHGVLTNSQDLYKGDHLLRSEIWLADWLQARHTVDFFTDLDLHGAPDLTRYAALVLGTHPEYWTQEMIAAIRTYLEGGGSLLYLGGNGMYRPTHLLPQTPGGDIDLLNVDAKLWPEYPLWEGKPLFAANVGNLLMTVENSVGYVVDEGRRFVPQGGGGLRGKTGINPWFDYDDIAPADYASWGAVGMEIDRWAAPLPAGVEEIGRDPGTDAVIATFQTGVGNGFVLGAGSITFVGAMVIDPTLQAIVENALEFAIGSKG